MVNMQAFVKELNLTVLSGSSGESWNLSSPEINRPGLELIGFYEHFAHERPQVMGNVEISYLDSLAPEDRKARLEKYFSFPIPVVIICRGLQPHKELLETARERDVPILQSQDSTTAFILDAILYLSKILAPRTTRHAVLVDVYGTGILITGESGVGKSETAIELIKRGHRLIADDALNDHEFGRSGMEPPSYAIQMLPPAVWGDPANDGDGTSLPVVTKNQQANRQRQFSQELRLSNASAAGTLFRCSAGRWARITTTAR